MRRDAANDTPEAYAPPKTLLIGPELSVANDVAVTWDIAYFIGHLKPKLGTHNADVLTALEKLIQDCGYRCRDEELADAKRAILGE